MMQRAFLVLFLFLAIYRADLFAECSSNRPRPSDRLGRTSQVGEGNVLSGQQAATGSALHGPPSLHPAPRPSRSSQRIVGQSEVPPPVAHQVARQPSERIPGQSHRPSERLLGRHSGARQISSERIAGQAEGSSSSRPSRPSQRASGHIQPLESVPSGERPHSFVVINDGRLETEFHLTNNGFLMITGHAAGYIYFFVQDGNIVRENRTNRRRSSDGSSTIFARFEPAIFSKYTNYTTLFNIGRDIVGGRKSTPSYCCHHFVIEMILKIVPEQNEQWLRQSVQNWPSNLRNIDVYRVPSIFREHPNPECRIPPSTPVDDVPSSN